jgi:hypothetical protein
MMIFFFLDLFFEKSFNIDIFWIIYLQTWFVTFNNSVNIKNFKYYFYDFYTLKKQNKNLNDVVNEITFKKYCKIMIPVQIHKLINVKNYLFDFGW